MRHNRTACRTRQPAGVGSFRIQGRELRRKYGDVMSSEFGRTNVVVLSGYKALKEALVKKSENVAVRPDLPVYVKLFQQIGEDVVRPAHGTREATGCEGKEHHICSNTPAACGRQCAISERENKGVSGGVSQ
ncbi:cytochrome P450 2D15-like [Leucoraja erinacea]|uniref:cytochrome P450 2D15-like n=1 Tax=Leucoraja erinaceus TaxID=7782 RepID=UPI002453F2A8|nr:cytochrome P450 2D15-like [Leucoraja erinacea]